MRCQLLACSTALRHTTGCLLTLLKRVMLAGAVANPGAPLACDSSAKLRWCRTNSFSLKRTRDCLCWIASLREKWNPGQTHGCSSVTVLLRQHKREKAQDCLLRLILACELQPCAPSQEPALTLTDSGGAVAAAAGRREPTGGSSSPGLAGAGGKDAPKALLHSYHGHRQRAASIPPIREQLKTDIQE